MKLTILKKECVFSQKRYVLGALDKQEQKLCSNPPLHNTAKYINKYEEAI